MSNGSRRTPWPLLVGVGCISAAILMVELALTRIFSVTMFYHFAFLAVSVALFGLSASGVYIYVLPKLHAVERLERHLRVYAIAFAIVTLLSTVILLQIPVALEPGKRTLWLMVKIYLLGAAPFFVGGACITLAISRLHDDIHRVYAADLTGGALGCMLLIPSLNLLGGPGAMIVAATLGTAAAALFAFADPSARRWLWMIPLAAALVGLGVQARRPWLDVRWTKGYERASIFSKWNSYSRVAVYREGHSDWGLSSTWRGPHPDSLFMDIDASASTPILLAKSIDDVAFLSNEMTAFGYRVMPAGGRALVIGSGGGRDLWSALVFGASHVDGVEVNPIIVNDVMGNHFRAESGNIYNRAGVTTTVDDGRSYVRRSQEKYDLIQASLVDTWAATAAGAFALTENNLYTVEAFVAYMNHLTPNGVLAMSRWEHDGLRLVALEREAATRLGWPTIADRLFIVKKELLATFVLKVSPLSAAEIQSLTNAANQLQFEVIYAPPVSPGAPRVESNYDRLLAAADPQVIYDGHALDISPPVDDRPFFFQEAKAKDLLPQFLAGDPLAGTNALFTLLGISMVLVLLFIVGPLALFARSRAKPNEPAPVGGAARPLLYFACLGAGFMMIEVGLMQRFVLLLGHPVYSLTVILFTLLLGGGMGSAISRRLGDARRALWAIPAIVGVGVIYALALPYAFEACIAWSRVARIALSVALLMPLGVLLGMPLPAGVKMVADRRPALLAWAWGINGALSVAGATAAILIALLWGFKAVALGGALVYVAAFAVGRGMTRQSG